MLRRWSLRTLAIAGLVGACTTGGDDGNDGGTDAGVDTSTDAPSVDSTVDTGVDAPGVDAADAADAGVDASPADAGSDAADAGTDAAADAETDAETDAGTTPSLYAGAVTDFGVDATNLYLLLPTMTTIAKCPLAGCPAGGPTTLLFNSHALSIVVSPSILPAPGAPSPIFYGYVTYPNANIDAIDSDGAGAPVNVWTYRGPPNIAFRSLRYNERVVYGSVRGQGMGTPAFDVPARYLQSGAGSPYSFQGSKVFDVRGDFGIEYVDSPSLGGARSFHSQRISTGVNTNYPAGAEVPVEITLHDDLVAFRVASGFTYFCNRANCAAPTFIPGVISSSLAIDADYLYMANPAGVVRCATAEMNGLGTCTADLFAPTPDATQQLVLTPTTLYVRTAAPNIIAVPIP